MLNTYSCFNYFIVIIFSIRVFFHGHWQLTGQQGKGGSIFLFHSTTSIRSRTFRNLICNFACEITLIEALVFTRLPLDEIYHLIELPFDWLMMWCWFLFIYLLTWLKFFVTATWHYKPMDLHSNWLSFLYYKRTD